MGEITVDPTSLAAVGVMTLVVVQAVKRLAIIQRNPDTIALISLAVGGIVGLVASFFTPIEPYQGIVAGLMASGSYDVLIGSKNMVTGTGK